MAPYALLETSLDVHSSGPRIWLIEQRDVVKKPTSADGLILESWAQGYMVGSLIIMAAVTVANMRRGVLLHKLILLELILGTFHGTFIFAHEPQYGWYLSVTAIFLNISWSLHNVISWIKTKPFLSRKWSLFYIGTVILAQPYWIVEIYANFTFFNNINNVFLHTRPYEALFRDPWWIFSTLNLFWNIHTSYKLPLTQIVVISPRFAVLLTAMCLSVAFIIVDIVAVTSSLNNILPEGLNPFWKLAFVFKCLTDSIVLDDFKTALDRLMRFKMQKDRFGTVDDTMAATVGSSELNGDDWGNGGSSMAYRSSEGTTTASSGGFGKAERDNSRSMRPRNSIGGSADPLGEDVMDQERLDSVEEANGQTMAGQQSQFRRGPRHFGSGSGCVGGDISFWDALNEGGDSEKRAGIGVSDRKGGARHIEHWEEMELGDFETSSKESSDGIKREPG